eukprot:44016-Eustigmatos_ZCMA.PRE.1
MGEASSSRGCVCCHCICSAKAKEEKARKAAAEAEAASQGATRIAISTQMRYLSIARSRPDMRAPR